MMDQKRFRMSLPADFNPYDTYSIVQREDVLAAKNSALCLGLYPPDSVEWYVMNSLDPNDPSVHAEIWDALWDSRMSPAGNSDVAGDDVLAPLVRLAQLSPEKIRRTFQDDHYLLGFQTMKAMIKSLDRAGALHWGCEHVLRTLVGICSHNASTKSLQIVRLMVEKYQCDLLALDGIVMAESVGQMGKYLAQATRYLPIRYCEHPWMPMVVASSPPALRQCGRNMTW